MTTPSFDPSLHLPWGALRPGAVPRVFTAAARAVPSVPVLKQLSFLFRRAARAGLDGPVDETLWGHRLRFIPRGNVSEGRLLFMPSSWDRAERRLIREFARPGAVMLDVGGNFGAYTWWLLSLLGRDATIVVLEPDPELNARLRFNLATNDWDNVRLLECAAGDREGMATLHLNTDNRGQNTLSGSGQEGVTGSVEVPVKPLAQVAREEGLDRIDILKIDIEGLEPLVLQAFLDQAPEHLWPELLLFERQDRPDYRELEGRLAREGYRLLHETRLNLVLHRERSSPPAS